MNRLGEREAVLKILSQMREEGTYSHVAVKETLDQCEREGMDRRQRAFVKRLAEGVIERRIELNEVIRRYVKKGTRIRPVIRDILQMGIFQILYMDSVPDSAACNEAVKLTKTQGKIELSGFVNGVLRTVAREKEKGVFENTAPGKDRQGTALEDPAELSRKYSMPEWIVRMWTEQLGGEETEELLAALMQIRPVSIRFDERIPEDRIAKTLEQMREQGVKCERGRYHPCCYYLTQTDSISALPGYREGLWTVQDESSMMVAEAAGLTGGETVYDVCAAPGGKSMHCASKLLSAAEKEGTEAGRVFAFDLTKGKVSQTARNVRRMRLDNVTVQQRDALSPVPDQEKGSADVLLCDLPCSGLGVIGRKRDIKYHVSSGQLKDLGNLQRDILRNAAGYLREGGTLIYSTCTINRGENEEIADFIEKELGFMPDPLAPHLPESLTAGNRHDGNCLQLLPHRHGTDGFFIARFVKKTKE